MGDSVDKMYEMALWGYAFGAHVYPFFRSGAASYLLMPLMAVAFIWRFVSALLEQDDELVLTTVKWIVGSTLILASLYNPITFSLKEKAELSDYMLGEKQAYFKTNQGSMPWIADKVDSYMDGWVKFAMMISKRENRFLYPGAAQSAPINLSKVGSLEDPQTRSIVSQWQTTIVPALMQNPSLAGKLKAENLVGILMYPVTSATDIKDGDGITQRSRRVIELLKNEPGLDLVSMVRGLSGLLNDPKARLSGQAMAVDANDTAVTAEMLSAYTTEVSSPPTAPPSYTPNMAKVYDAGYKALSAVANDPKRQPLTSYDNFGDLYQHIGFAVDIAIAKRNLQTEDDIMAIGVTCANGGQDSCMQGLTLAPTNMKVPEDGWNLANRSLRAANATASLIGSMYDDAAMEFAKVKIPLYIGVAKGLVTAATPLFLILMLWPGRFAMGLTFMLGGYVLVNLWMVLYILWTYLVSDFLFGIGFEGKVSSLLGPQSVMGGYDVMVSMLKIGYGVLATVSWMVVFGGMDKMHRSLGGTSTSGRDAVKDVTQRAKFGVKATDLAMKGGKSLASLGRFIPKG